ncbi:hypothetical protein QSJ18_13000 [Gordonia sp. ABSL1-1]|uniref:hypothetical protein n=1 Tax=Gordonia sp. ABSL1-1 TaxID=3053923 RepID=UPI00257338F3|nr:hypothetical protein [Gordonia sp. ABSL1-1]MDL9937667.1 hypothetical protein [Gordonia sp. ABSL1-1]
MGRNHEVNSRRALEDELRAHGFPASVAATVRRRSLFVRTVPIFAGLMVAFVEVALFTVFWEDGLGALRSRLHLAYLLVNVAAVAAPFAVSRLVGRGLAALAPTIRRRAAAVIFGVLLVVVPAAMAAALAGTHATWAAVSGASGLLLAVVAVALAYTGAGVIIGWSARQAKRQVKSVWSFVGQMLPVLVIVVLFFLCAPEAWQLAASQSRARMWTSVAGLGAVSLLVIIISATDNLTSDQQRRAAGRRLGLKRSEKVNAVSLVTIAQVIQMCVVAAVTFVFFLLIGLAMVPRATMTKWVCDPDCSDVDPWMWDAANERLTDGSLFGLYLPADIPQVLVQLCMIVSAVAMISFVGSITLESEHHRSFYAPVLRSVDAGLAIRDRYVNTYLSPGSGPRSITADDDG